MPLVNDVHSQLNPSRVRASVRLRSIAEATHEVKRAAATGEAIAIAGGRHAMGGQQFAHRALLLDTTGLDRVVGFDARRGLVEVEAGIMWPALHAWLVRAQPRCPERWTFRQKQTGADRFTLGGSLSANIHGRGLAMPPFVADVEAFTLIDAAGQIRRCSRTENARWFALAIGGYGLFGVVVTVTLRLSRRQWVERVVTMCDAADAMAALCARISEGCLYGDFQFSIDPRDDGFLDRGILSCYRPVSRDARRPRHQRSLSRRDWNRLLWLAHTDKHAAFEEFARFYRSTSGQVYGSDDHQLGYYLDGYHAALDSRLGHRGSEMIGELYVPRPRLTEFLAGAARDFRRHDVDVVYGTVRLIRRDVETFLPWARDDYACVVFNLHTPHDTTGVARTAAAFRRLIDLAGSCAGSFYLTYHRYATRSQIATCHPRFEQFLALKRELDPNERFQSDWYRHCRQLFGLSAARPACERLTAARTS
jgi:FAD/FMN-containing dehydrogenase